MLIETDIDKINQSIQVDTLRRLAIAISCFLLVSLFESFLDIVANIQINNDPDYSEKNKLNCDYIFTSDSLSLLNPIYHFISRAISNFSAIFVTLYLFWKKRVSKRDKQKHDHKLMFGPTYEIEYREDNSNITISSYNEENKENSF